MFMHAMWPAPCCPRGRTYRNGCVYITVCMRAHVYATCRVLLRPHRMCPMCVWARTGVQFSKFAPAPKPQPCLAMRHSSCEVGTPNLLCGAKQHLPQRMCPMCAWAGAGVQFPKLAPAPKPQPCFAMRHASCKVGTPNSLWGAKHTPPCEVPSAPLHLSAAMLGHCRSGPRTRQGVWRWRVWRAPAMPPLGPAHGTWHWREASHASRIHMSNTNPTTERT